MPPGRSPHLLCFAGWIAFATAWGCLSPAPASAATPPTVAIIAKIEAARKEQAKTPFTLSLTVRDERGSRRFVAKKARCEDGEITLSAAPAPDEGGDKNQGSDKGAREATMILSKEADGSALALWLTLCEPNPLEVIGARGGLIASEVEILANATELYYQLGKAQKLLVSHALDRVLGVTLKQGKKTYRAAARGRMTPETTLPKAAVVWIDGRQTITASLSALPAEK